MSIGKSTLIVLTCAAALAACGKPEPVAPAENSTASVAPPASSAFANAPSLVPAAAAPVAPEHAEGKRMFDKNCGLCHGAGVGGAPRPGDKANWAPRIAQGVDILHRHALEGFNGGAGYMPARGGVKATDAEVKAGVDYMVAQSR